MINDFFNTLLINTNDNYKKLVTDLERNYKAQGTLTYSQATWIKNALKKNKKLRGLEVPEEIQEEMIIALNDQEQEQEHTDDTKIVIDREQLNDIILEEFGNMITSLVERILQNAK